MSQNLIYPIFANCADYTLDPYWIDMFMQCSKNKFPKGCSYDSKNHIIYVKDAAKNARNHRNPVKLPEKPSDIFQIMMHIFKTNLRLRSSHDLQISKQDLQKIKDSYEVDLSEWKKIKPRSMKDVIIMRYVIRLEKEHGLTTQQANELYTTIKVGMQFNKITNTDIDYSNGSINSINGLDFDKGTKIYSINNEIKCVPKTEKKTASQKFNQAVDLFIKNCKNKKICL